MPEIEWACWLAGFFDGEGNVTFTHNGNGWANLRLGLSQNDRTMLDVVCKQFGGKVRPHGLACHHWELTDAPGMRRFLTFILPYLRVKNREAGLALDFAKLMKSRGKRLTQLEKDQRAEILALALPSVDDNEDDNGGDTEEWEDELPGEEQEDDE